MNDDNDLTADSGDDAVLEEMFSQLRRLEPPLEARIANRLAIAAELSGLLQNRQELPRPWWRRSISVPVPIAASLLALVAFLLASTFRGRDERAPVQVVAPEHPAPRETETTREKTALAMQSEDARPALEYYETETYLCGIGRLNSVSGYFIKEQKP